MKRQENQSLWWHNQLPRPEFCFYFGNGVSLINKTHLSTTLRPRPLAGLVKLLTTLASIIYILNKDLPKKQNPPGSTLRPRPLAGLVKLPIALASRQNV